MTNATAKGDMPTGKSGKHCCGIYFLWFNPCMHILYVDACLLVLNKPAGLPVLPDGWEPDAPYLVKLLEPEYGRIWVVHRLDKITSGAMVFARTVEAHRALNIQFERHEAQKVYHAIIAGAPRWEEHVAKHPLRANVGHNHRTVVDTKRGKDAETRFKIIQREQAWALVEALPQTGRTHQIRVHLAALGHPILGDVLYGAPPTDIIARPALHALSLTFTHPESGERLTFTAPYPQDFVRLLKQNRP